MIKKSFLLVLSSLVLASCGSSPSASSSSVQSSSLDSSISSSSIVTSKEPYKDERDYSYANKIDKPSDTVHNVHELAAITDYYAFYKVEHFDVTLASNYVYSCGSSTIKKELNSLYWVGEMINGVIGMDATLNNRTLSFTYTFYENATVFKEYRRYQLNDITYYANRGNRAPSYNDFATEDSNKNVADVATSQQLWYAAEQGYKINPIPGSKAEKYYDMAKDILRRIIKDDMNDKTKYEAIYDYIAHNAVYDYAALEDPEPENPSLYPDVYAATDKCYFLEGFFDHGVVVCDGFSKIMTLLGKMEGLDIVRSSGPVYYFDYTTRAEAGHAYNFINIDGIYYLGDITWDQDTVRRDKVMVDHGNFMTGKKSHESYRNRDWPDINVINTNNSLGSYYESSLAFIDGKETTKMITEEDGELLDLYLNKVADTNNSYACLALVGDESFTMFKDKVKTLGLAYSPSGEVGGTVYASAYNVK